MFNYTYQTVSPSGKFYIGRHSTENLDDGYMGSGKWVRSIKDKSKLDKEILGFYDNFEDLLRAEQQLLEEFVGQKDCMNFINTSNGFGTGNSNIINIIPYAKEKMIISINSKKEISRRRDLQLSLLEKGECQFQKPEVRERQKLSSAKRNIELFSKGSHPFQKDEIKKVNRQRFIDNNPIYKEKNKKAASERIKILNGVYLTCPYCSKSTNKGNFIQYHGDNCKEKRAINETYI